MVGIGHRMRGNIPRLVPAVAVLVEEQTHKLGNTKRRMRVVYMDSNAIREVIERGIGLKMSVQNALNGRRHKEILLLEP